MCGLLELGNTESQETDKLRVWVGEKNIRQFRWITAYDLLRHMYDVPSGTTPRPVSRHARLRQQRWTANSKYLLGCCSTVVLLTLTPVCIRMVGSGRHSRTGVSTADAMIFVPRAAT